MSAAMNMLDSSGAGVGTIVPSCSSASAVSNANEAFIERLQRYQALRQAGFDEETSTKYSTVVFGSVNEVIDSILSQTLQQSLSNYASEPNETFHTSLHRENSSHFALYERGNSSTPPLALVHNLGPVSASSTVSSSSPSSPASSSPSAILSTIPASVSALSSLSSSSLSSSLTSSLSSASNQFLSTKIDSLNRFQFEPASMLVAGVLKDGFGSDASCEDE